MKVTQTLIDLIADPKLEKLSQARTPKEVNYFWSKRSYINPICQGCKKELNPGEEVYKYRNLNFVHITLDCIKKINKYGLTKGLKSLL